MVELGWTTSEVTQEHLQHLMSQGYMTVVEFATHHLPEDPASPTLVGDMLLRARHSTSEDSM
jgi:ribulose bisphosphate carboxylase small subunit